MRAIAFCLIALVLVFSGCEGSQIEHSVPDPFSVQGNQIKIDMNSKFAKHLEITEVQSAPGDAQALRSVGQMIALANRSGELSGSKISWVELDPKLTKNAGIVLNEKASTSIGVAFGVATLPVHYLSQIHEGEQVQISRYGLRKVATTGEIISVKQHSAEAELVQIVFRIKQGQEWYPGTNCEIEFPLVKSHPVRISKNSLLNEGLREFVYKEVSPGQFVAKHVAVVGETANEVYVLGDISSGDRLIGRGAILLKPLAHSLSHPGQGEDGHVYP